MAYMALYRKLRPNSFQGVIGQEHITRTLINQIEGDRITHAYLFCGTRGTGKTSTAKIFAKAVNCLNPKDGEPCNKCEVCKAIDEGRNFNVLEIDAASNNGVENIRDIREEVQYPPTEGKYKVYIIDEVHMLSIGAFNALLKTLEEPPAFVIFILATTDPQKIPVTILSRCQRFDFRRITSKDIADTLRGYMAEENVDIDDDALDYIARIADGGMRDALSILDQCISFYYGEKITLDKVLEIVGSVDKDIFFKFAEAINELDGKKCMEMIEEIVTQGRDISQFVNELTLHFRNLLITQAVGGESTALDFSKETIEKFKVQSEKIGKDRLMQMINDFSMLQTQLKYAPNSRVLLEVCCIKMCNPLSREETLGNVMGMIKELESKIKSGTIVVNNGNSNMLNNQDAEKLKSEKIYKIKAIPEDIQNVIACWDNVVSNFSGYDMAVLSTVSPRNLEDNFLYLVCPTQGHYDRVKAIKERLEEILSEAFKKEFEIQVIKKDEYDARSIENYGEKDSTIKNNISREDFGSLASEISFED